MDATTKARLDKQAAAIRDLRKQVSDMGETVSALEEVCERLLAVVAASTGASPSTIVLGAETGRSPRPPDWHPSYGTYIPSPLCAMCGGDKEPGRTQLTCKTCAAQRQDIVRNGLDRAPITRAACFSCGATFRAQTRFLCTECTKGHKKWAADQ